MFDDVWRPWFAWRPVGCDDCVVWLETIERKPAESWMIGSCWEYRFKGAQDDEGRSG